MPPTKRDELDGPPDPEDDHTRAKPKQPPRRFLCEGPPQPECASGRQGRRSLALVRDHHPVGWSATRVEAKPMAAFGLLLSDRSRLAGSEITVSHQRGRVR